MVPSGGQAGLSVASSKPKGQGQGTPYDPRERQLRDAAIYGQGVTGGRSIDDDESLETTLAQQSWATKIAQGAQAAIAKDAELKRQAAADLQRIAMRGTQQRAKHLQQTQVAASKSKLQDEQRRAASQGKQPSPWEQANAAVNKSVGGTEVPNIQPMAPMSRAPRGDITGGGASEAAVENLVRGGAMAQQALPGLQRGAGPEQAVTAAMGGPQQGPQGGRGPSVQVGGQTFQAPEELVRQVSSLGAKPMRLLGGYGMAPTFETRTIREPNVLTAESVANLQMRQEESIRSLGVQLWQDAEEGAHLPEAIDAARSLATYGDSSRLASFGSKSPSMGKAVVRAELDMRKVQQGLMRAQTRQALLEGDYTAEQAAYLKYVRAGLADAQNFGAWVGLGVGGGGVGPQGGGGVPRMPGLGGGGGGGDVGMVGERVQRIDVGNLVNKDGDINDIAWLQWQQANAVDTGRIYYRPTSGALDAVRRMVAGGPELASVYLPDVAASVVVASQSSEPAARKAAVEFLQSVPWLDVAVGKDGRVDIDTDPGFHDRGAVDMTETFLRNLGSALEHGQALPLWLTNPAFARSLYRGVGAPAGGEGAAPVAIPPSAAPLTPEEAGRMGREARRQLGIGTKELAKAAGRGALTATKATGRGIAIADQWLLGFLGAEQPMSVEEAEQLYQAGPFGKGPLVGPKEISAQRLPGGVAQPQRARTAPRAELRAPRPILPKGEERALPAGPLGPEGRAPTAQEVMMLRAMGFPVEVIRNMPASMVAEILGAAQARQMPPQIRALVPRGMMPVYPPPQRAR